MTKSFKFLAVALLAAGLIGAAGTADAQFSKEQIKCRSAVAKNAAKLLKTASKTLTACHKDRAKDGSLSILDCNDLTAADAEKGKTAGTTAKLLDAIGGSKTKCPGIVPADILYGDDCPAPCGATISSMSDVGTCVDCLVRNAAETMSSDNMGGPSSPLPTKDLQKCSGTIGKGYAKLADTVMKELAKCQSGEEKDGATTTTTCIDAFMADGISKIEGAEDKTEAGIGDKCAVVPAPFSDITTCDNSGAAAAGACTASGTSNTAGVLAAQILDFSASGGVTTTTTLGGVDGCPVRGELTLWGGVGSTTCANNTDCTNADPLSPQTCDTGLGRCVTPTELDAGWTGAGHDGDVNEKVLTRGFIECNNTPSPGCGECDVTGIDPAKSVGLCRCRGDLSVTCDAKFGLDAGDCGHLTVSNCDCYFGAPFPLVSDGTPACITNKFALDVSGTADIDTGLGKISANLLSQVYLGESSTAPCPYCGNVCSNATGTGAGDCAADSDCGVCQDTPGLSCFANVDCTNNGSVGPCTFGTCPQDTPNDGVKNGVCVGGLRDNLACDITALNTTFPIRPHGVANGGGYSLDCPPSNSKNASGNGLSIVFEQTSGVSDSLVASVPCGANGAVNCPCRMCTGSGATTCTSDTDCSGGSCSGAASVTCNGDPDCAAADIGPCNLNGGTRCFRKSTVVCASNADCLNQNVGTCNLNTCSSDGIGRATNINDCTNGAAGCADIGGGEGECNAVLDERKFCSGVLKANGRGAFSCGNNADCAVGVVTVDGGTCDHVEQKECFLDPVTGVGVADPVNPVGVAAFCIPPPSGAIATVAGLPGPGRARNQASVRYLCADGVTEYTPGTANCP